MSLLQVSHRCPHCNELKDFVVSDPHELRPVKLDDKMPPLWSKQLGGPVRSIAGRMGADPRGTRASNGYEFAAVSRCPNCANPVMLVLIAVAEDYRHRITRGSNERIPSDAFELLHMFPEAQSFGSHDSWPDKIKAPFIEIQEDIARGRTAGRIIAGCRSVLDVATKDLLGRYRPDDPDPERPKGKRPREDIFSRVNSLRDLGLLTGALGDWAHKLRELGADATHDLDGKDEDARQFVDFLKLFLHVAYELPALIKEQWPDAPELPPVPPAAPNS